MLQNAEKCRKITYFCKNICAFQKNVVPLHAFWALVNHTRMYIDMLNARSTNQINNKLLTKKSYNAYNSTIS